MSVYHRALCGPEGLTGKYARVAERLPVGSSVLEIGLGGSQRASAGPLALHGCGDPRSDSPPLLHGGDLAAVAGERRLRGYRPGAGRRHAPLESRLARLVPTPVALDFLRRGALAIAPRLFSVVLLIEASAHRGVQGEPRPNL